MWDTPKITFFDIETTGLDPQKNEILELAVVAIEPITLDIVSEFTFKTKPVRLETAHPKALEVCGYNEIDWRDAVDLKTALRFVYPLLYRCIPGGHNVSFDVRFLEHAYRKEGMSSPEFHSIHVDTQTIASELRRDGLYPEKRSLSLDSVASYFEVFRPSPHRAYDDVQACLGILRKVKDLRRQKE